MNLAKFLNFATQAAWAPEDGAGAGGETASAEQGAGEAPAAAVQTALAGADEGSAAQAADKGADEGAQKADQKAEGSEKGNDTDQGPEEFAVDVPDGMDGFKGDFEAYQGAAGDYLKANPNATPAEALKWAAGYQAKLVSDGQASQQAQFVEQVETWETEAKADKEFGGAQYAENVAVARGAIDAFGTPALKELLNDSGLGSHPELIRFAFKAGQAVKDAPVLNTSGGGARRSLSDALYDKK